MAHWHTWSHNHQSTNNARYHESLSLVRWKSKWDNIIKTKSTKHKNANDSWRAFTIWFLVSSDTEYKICIQSNRIKVSLMSVLPFFFLFISYTDRTYIRKFTSMYNVIYCMQWIILFLKYFFMFYFYTVFWFISLTYHIYPHPHGYKSWFLLF